MKRGHRDAIHAYLDRSPAGNPDPGRRRKCGQRDAFKVAPETCEVDVRSPKHNQFQGSIQSLKLKIEPCRRCYINAQFGNSVSATWRPVIDYVETITGCRIPGRPGCPGDRGAGIHDQR